MSGFEYLTHAEMIAVVNGGSPGTMTEHGRRLMEIAPQLSSVAEDIHDRMAQLEWEGDSATEFRKWANHFRRESTALKNYALTMAAALQHTGEALSEARSSMPEEPPAFLEDIEAGQFGIEQTPRDEALAVLRRLSSSYEVATERLTSAEEPRFKAPRLDAVDNDPPDSAERLDGLGDVHDQGDRQTLDTYPAEGVAPGGSGRAISPLGDQVIGETGRPDSRFPVPDTPVPAEEETSTSLDSVATPSETVPPDTAREAFGGGRQAAHPSPAGTESRPHDLTPTPPSIVKTIPSPTASTRRGTLPARSDASIASLGGGSGRSVVGGVPGVSGPGVGRQVVPPGGLGGVPPRGVVGAVPRQPDGGARRAVPGGVVGRGVGSAVRDPVTGAVRGPGGGLVRRSAKKDPPGASFVSRGPVARGGDESVDPPGVTGRPRETRRKRRRVAEGESSESERDTSK